jgi:hypothetical protein
VVSRYHACSGSWAVVASQWRWTSKSVERYMASGSATTKSSLKAVNAIRHVEKERIVEEEYEEQSVDAAGSACADGAGDDDALATGSRFDEPVVGRDMLLLMGV